MARTHGIVLLALVLGGTGLWLTLARGNAHDPLPGSGAASHAATSRPPPDDPPAHRVAIDREAPAPPSQPDPASPTSTPELPGPGSDPPDPGLRVRVRSLPEGVPLPGFRWTLWSEGRRSTGVADADGADVVLPLAAEQPFTLLLEADGHQPLRHEGSGQPGPTQTLELFLARAAPRTGIGITARDHHGQPVTSLRVDVWQLAPDAGLDQTGADHAPLWSRRTSEPSGDYQLPQLAPGRYELRAMAVEADGALLPLLPFRSRFESTGSNHVPLVVALVPGAVLTLDVLDRNGNLLPARHAADGSSPVQLRATGPDGQVHTIDWRSEGNGAAPPVVTRNLLPSPGPATAAEALPAGSWRIDVWIEGAQRGGGSFLLLEGSRHRERILAAWPPP